MYIYNRPSDTLQLNTTYKSGQSINTSTMLYTGNKEVSSGNHISTHTSEIIKKYISDGKQQSEVKKPILL